MKQVRYKNVFVLGVISLLISTGTFPSSIGFFIDTNNIKNVSKHQYSNSSINKSILDINYIYNITKALCDIIFTEYNESAGEITKGREFGTKGEIKAAEILFENMTKLGLYTRKEPINNTPITLSETTKKIASKVEILEKGLIIKKISDGSILPITECYFSSRSNFTEASLCPLTPKLISFISPTNGTLDKKYNFNDEERLTYNFSYTNLKVIRQPYYFSFPSEIFHYYTNNEGFVYIAKDTDFCKWPEPIPEIKYLGPVFKLLNFVYQKSFNKVCNYLPQTYEQLYEEMLLWTLFEPNCKGLILFDSNNYTYNNVPGVSIPLPTIRINGSLGKKIFNDSDDYRIDFYLNQQWNESVKSYNVIGQINGTNPNETIIISSQYDSQWNQGCGDSAIAMAMVLGIAKYIKDYNIKPKCNVRFIGFCGEEFRMRGAYYYEVMHRNENISMVIDLNQLGFNWTKTKLTLEIFTNNVSLNSTINNIAYRTNYVKRTENISNFYTQYQANGGLSSNAIVFANAKARINRSYNTILFIKTGEWYFHHKDGMNHLEGDVIKYFDWNDTNVTGEMIWNVTRNFIIDNSIN